MEDQKLSKKNIIIIISAAVAAVLMVAGIYIMLRFTGNNTGDSAADNTTVAETTAETTTAQETLPETEPETTSDFVSSKDFAALKETYPHCYAWIEIPGTNISYPIIQHPTDDEYYLRKNAEGKYDECGCIFTEHRYNNDDFTDPVTVVYGHYVNFNNEPTFFGGLQTMYAENLTDFGEIVVYHPNRELHFEVFAAVPYHDLHILYGEDFTKEEDLNRFLASVKDTKAPDAVINNDCEVKVGDQLIVLSTCYNGGPDRRFIVVAKLVEAFD